jgi:hypothetical protein
MTDVEATAYVNFLHHGNVMNLDQAFTHFGNKTSEFWKKILMNICGINEQISEIWSQNKSNMITEVLYRHYRVFSMTKDFADVVKKFEKLSKENLSDLYML